MKGKSGNVTPNDGAMVIKEAHQGTGAFKKGGAVKKKVAEEVVEGCMPSRRLDKRARGGSVIKNTGAPYSTASRLSAPKA